MTVTAVDETAASADEHPTEPVAGRHTTVLAQLRRVVAPAIRSDRLATRLFLAYLALAWVLLVFHWGAGRWFSRDDFFLLTSRDAGSLTSLLEPHGEHLIALPAFIYRMIFNMVGVRFGPYLISVVSMHIGVVITLRALMRRNGVGPWIASIAAGLLALFGSGEENILWAFQIGFVGSVLFGLLAVFFADRREASRRSDIAGAFFGCLAVLSSGVGPVIVLAAGAIALVRRGERSALIHTIPAGVLYAIWYATMEPSTGIAGKPPLSTALRWALEGWRMPLVDLSKNRLLAAVLGVLVVAGLLIAVGRSLKRDRQSPLVTPIVMTLVAPVFYFVVAQGRWWGGIRFAESGRYVYVATALTLPLIAIAVSALITQWRWAALPVGVALVAGVPGNIDRFDNSPVFNSTYYLTNKQVVLGVAQDFRLDTAEGWVRFLPEYYNGTGLTVDWLRNARDSGMVPAIDFVDPAISGQVELRLTLAQQSWLFPAPVTLCDERIDPLGVHLEAGEDLRIYTDVVVTLMRDGQPVSTGLLYRTGDGNGLLRATQPMDVLVTTSWGMEPFRACKAS